MFVKSCWCCLDLLVTLYFQLNVFTFLIGSNFVAEKSWNAVKKYINQTPFGPRDFDFKIGSFLTGVRSVCHVQYA